MAAALRGNREPIVLGADWDYKQIQISPSDSQFLDTGRYTSAECARIYGPGMPEILGYETGGSMTYANIEQRALDLLTFTLDPWLVRMERLLSALLPNPQYVKFERKALLRTDMLTRFQAHQIALHNQFETVNEVRDDRGHGPRRVGRDTRRLDEGPRADRPVAPAPAPSGKK
jgi:HK97 family phage portal protein